MWKENASKEHTNNFLVLHHHYFGSYVIRSIGCCSGSTHLWQWSYKSYISLRQSCIFLHHIPVCSFNWSFESHADAAYFLQEAFLLLISHQKHPAKMQDQLALKLFYPCCCCRSQQLIIFSFFLNFVYYVIVGLLVLCLGGSLLAIAPWVK